LAESRRYQAETWASEGQHEWFSRSERPTGSLARDGPRKKKQRGERHQQCRDGGIAAESRPTRHHKLPQAAVAVKDGILAARARSPFLTWG
jgi:hypothetical protein